MPAAVVPLAHIDWRHQINALKPWSSPETLVCADISGQPLSQAIALARAWLKDEDAPQKIRLMWLTDLASFARQVDLHEAQCCGVAPWAVTGLQSVCLTDSRIDLTIGVGEYEGLASKLRLQADVVVCQEQSVIPVGLARPLALLVRLDRQDVELLSTPQAPLAVKQSAIRRDRVSKARRVAIVGGGITGLTTAAVLADDGCEVTVVDAQRMHEGHVAAALTPVISSDDNPRSRLSRAGALAAGNWWREFGGQATLACGALQLQRPAMAKRVTDLQAQAHALDMPQWARWVGPDAASEIAGLQLSRGGIFYPGAWMVKVGELLAHIAKTFSLQQLDHRVHRMSRVDQQWRLFDAHGALLTQADTVVLANAFDTVDLLKRSDLSAALDRCRRLPSLHRLAGEVTCLPATSLAGGPHCIVGGDGYVLPAVNGWCVTGGTYVRGAAEARCTEEGRVANIERARDLLSIDTITMDDKLDTLPGWAGWRAVLPGRLPAIGPLSGVPACWVFTGGASRGLTWSVLGAKLIRDGIKGHQPTLESDLLDMIAL